jgi:sentrin-specific protease 1
MFLCHSILSTQDEIRARELLKLRDFTPVELTTREHALSSSMVVEGFGYRLTASDLQPLSPLHATKKLNDEIVNFFMALLTHRSFQRFQNVALPQQQRPDCYFFNSFFYKKLTEYGGYSNVQRWTNKRQQSDKAVLLRQPLFDYQYCFLPVHVSNNHWCLVRIDFPGKKLSYFDSFIPQDYSYAVGRLCLDNLLRYLEAEFADKEGPTFVLAEWTTELVSRSDVPQQGNGFDCGMFALKIAEYLSEGLPLTFKQSNMPYFRNRMLVQILNKCID